MGRTDARRRRGKACFGPTTGEVLVSDTQSRWRRLRGGLHSMLKWSCLAAVLGVGAAHAADKPNIVLIVSDDFGYGDAGAYGGGANRGMPTPALDRMAGEGMTFLS